MEYAIELRHITKTFGSVVANHDVSLDVRKGEILSLLGENGSGKTTLMNMIAGIYYPDSGEIIVDGKLVEIRSPKDAYALGIGMVHQHFKLIDVFTAAENIALVLDKQEKYNLKDIKAKAQQICERYSFDIDLEQKVYEMSVSQKQTLEIIKMLYRGAQLLILDEPTAVLTPQETEKLFAVMRNMRADGKSIIIITHKLHEVLSISDRVAILRKGEYAGTIDTAAADEASLTELMVGKKVELNIEREAPVNPHLRLNVHNLTITNAEGIKVLDQVSFEAFSGEILGIAGISGNGQKELLEAIAGLQHPEKDSSIVYYPDDDRDSTAEQLIGKSPKNIRDMGIHLSFVPEDRLGMGLVGSMGMIDNMMLKTYSEGHSPLVDRKGPRYLAEEIKDELGVVTPSISTPVSRLSGGNVQKVLVGREIAAAPSVLMTAYAVRGLDINTSYTIYHLLNEQKKSGVAIIYVGEDLDVLIDLCDRILILCGGKCNGIVDARKTNKEEVGLLMTRLAGKQEGGVA
ncbi:MAG: ABC transporter ATP-binding protein [Clostridia bacterium]|nr:ABC transporter ATP-binding protein [Clostridia bacterium]MBQ6859240.1 ABC transporter ATP-binding protein [Clostridia bacterium]MBQ7052753.1 ABC transporter ATP-binding protein [Clostridia bacterium]